ncbi:hypothetical protein, partial [Sphingobium jiangsuense]
MKRGVLITIVTGTGALALLSGAWIASAQQVVVSGRTASMADEQRAYRQASEQAKRARALSRQLEAQASAATREADRLNA